MKDIDILNDYYGLGACCDEPQQSIPIDFNFSELPARPIDFNFSELPARPIDLVGQVVNELGEPLPGANIFLTDNPTVGAATDFDGFYNLNGISGGVNVTFSYQANSVTLKSDQVPKVVTINTSNALDVVDLGVIKRKRNLQYAGFGLLALALIWGFTRNKTVKASI